MKKGKISAEKFDAKFDAGEDVTEHLDLSSARKPGLEIQRVNVDMPKWMIEGLQRQADRIGVTRQAYMKMVLADNLDQNAKP